MKLFWQGIGDSLVFVTTIILGLAICHYLDGRPDSVIPIVVTIVILTPVHLALRTLLRNFKSKPRREHV